jgi:prolyl-tRNA synthetase
MTASISMLRSRLQSGPIIATGGLLRVLLGPGTPLFRDRYMWPAVQVSHVVPRNQAANTLDAYQCAIEDVIRALGLPVVSVRTSQLPEYGKLCYLTVSVLPDGRPTILSTSYIMAERYRTALRVDDEVLDIGFTGKLIALAAMHHCDFRGIMLPSVIAGTQVGALLDDSPGAREWLDAQLRAGLRVEHAHPGPQPYRRIRAECRMHRRGTPLVVGLYRDRPHVGIVRRGPLERVRQLTAPPPEAIRTELAAYDRQLLVRSSKKFHNGLTQTGAIRGLCQACARTEPIFGWVAPRRETACAHCGRAGAEALVSPQGRFY